MIRILLVDDQPLMRAAFRALLDAEDDFDVVGEAGNGNEGLAAALEHLPDVALIDVEMPAANGIDMVRRLAADERLRDVRAVMLTNYGHDEYVFDALRAGASGFLLKGTEPDDLLQGIRVVARGDALLAPSITRRLINDFVSQPRVPDAVPALAALTNREREVVALVARGLTNDEIAAEAVISPTTAKTHVSRAMIKLNARDRAQLVVMAYESGLVTPSG